MNKYLYAVTGEIHGSIVEAESIVDAMRMFNETYHDEEIWHVKDLTNNRIWNL